MEDNFVNNVITLYKDKDWKTIVDKYYNYPERNKLLWVFPSEKNLQFLEKCLEELNVDEITSVGCGSGLLEWIVKEATGIPVTGVEIDGAWWRCKYAPPTFIPLVFTTSNLQKNVIDILENKRSAMLFCYFNNRPAFEDYLKHFMGNVLIIIGPGDGKGVHSDPKPFGDVESPWTMYQCQEVRDSKDFIAIYCKT